MPYEAFHLSLGRRLPLVCTLLICSSCHRIKMVAWHSQLESDSIRLAHLPRSYHSASWIPHDMEEFASIS